MAGAALSRAGCQSAERDHAKPGRQLSRSPASPAAQAPAQRVTGATAPTIERMAANPAPPKLPASLEYADIEIRGNAKLFIGEPDDDPGLLRLSASISIYDFPDDGILAEPDLPAAGIEGIGLSATPLEDGRTKITILKAEGLILDLFRIENPFETLDAISDELTAYACLFDLENGGLALFRQENSALDLSDSMMPFSH